MSQEAKLNELFLGGNHFAKEDCTVLANMINSYKQLHDTKWFQEIIRKAPGDQTTPALIDGIFEANYMMPEAKLFLQTKEDLMILYQNLSKLMADLKDGNIEFQLSDGKYRIIKERNGEIAILQLKGDTNVKRFTLLEYMKDKLSNLTKMKDIQQIAKVCSHLGMLTLDLNYQKDQLRLNEQVLNDMAARLKSKVESVERLSSKLKQRNTSLLKYKMIVLCFSIITVGCLSFSIWLGHQANVLTSSMVCSPK